jgi:hypothetical protein
MQIHIRLLLPKEYWGGDVKHHRKSTNKSAAMPAYEKAFVLASESIVLQSPSKKPHSDPREARTKPSVL